MSIEKRKRIENKFAGMEGALLVPTKIARESATQFHAIFSGFSARSSAASDRAIYRDLEEPRGRQGTTRWSTRTRMGRRNFWEFELSIRRLSIDSPSVMSEFLEAFYWTKLPADWINVPSPASVPD